MSSPPRSHGTAPLVAYKRWALLPGISPESVAAFVAAQIVPHYARLSEHVALGLEVAADRGTIVAVQRWASRAARDAAMSGPAFEAWWEAYQPALQRWSEMVDFVDEWESEELIAAPLPSRPSRAEHGEG